MQTTPPYEAVSLRDEMTLENRLRHHGLLYRNRPLLVWQPSSDRTRPSPLEKRVIEVLVESSFDIALVGEGRRQAKLIRRLGEISPYVAQLTDLREGEMLALLDRSCVVLQGEGPLLSAAEDAGLKSVTLSETGRPEASLSADLEALRSGPCARSA